MTNQTQYRYLLTACVLSIIIHTAAALTMATVLGQGLDTNPDLRSRLSFISQNSTLWSLSWFAWNLAALAIVNFFVAMKNANDDGSASRRHLLTLALCVGATAIIGDLSAEAIEMGLVPRLAADAVKVLDAGADAFNAAANAFLIVNRIVVLTSGYGANLFYTLAVLFQTIALKNEYPWWLTALGFAVVACGIFVSVTAMLADVAGMFWSNAILIPLLVLWQSGIALMCVQRLRGSAEST